MSSSRRSSAKKRIVVGLSGGVDSAVGAWLLKQQGHEVVGVFMQNWTDDDRAAGPGYDDRGGPGLPSVPGADGSYCSSRQDFLDAASVADVLGIEIEHVNFAAEYKERVFAEFLREYRAGRTPNPDVLCNSEIKFSAFLDHAMRLGADRIATGHYARVRCRAVSSERASAPPTATATSAPSGEFELLKGLDPLKDQSYFLHRLSQAQLSRTLFPIGELPKTEVRRLAAEIGLPVAAKRDSTGICFIGERPFREFLGRYLATEPGPIENDRGQVVGTHVGLAFYTLGQRKGIGLGGVKARGSERGGSAHAPWFVARKDLARNVLVVVQGHAHRWLMSSALVADDISWIAGRPPTPPTLSAKTRYRQHDAACRIASCFSTGEAGADGVATVDRIDASVQAGAIDRVAAVDASGIGHAIERASKATLTVDFAEPQWAVTPGQSVVFYDGEVCLGGALIRSSTTRSVSDAAARNAPDAQPQIPTRRVHAVGAVQTVRADRRHPADGVDHDDRLGHPEPVGQAGSL